MNAPTVLGQFSPELSAQALALPLISPERFAELTGVPPGVLRGWMSRGYVPTYPIGCWRAFKTDHLCALNFDQAFC